MTTRTAAFFDLDGTLIPGSANIPFAKAAFRQGFISTSDLVKDLRNGVSFLLKGASDERSEQVRDRILQAVEGHRAADVEALGHFFIDELVGSITPAMRTVLDQHGAAGDQRIVISASPTEIVSRLAHEAGLESGVGTTAARDADGVYTGELAGPFCYKHGKVEVMEQLAADHGYDLADCYAYSDSASDMPMLEAVGHPVAVNPEPELREIAADRGWPIVETSSVPRVELTSARGLVRMGRNLVGAAGRRVLAA